MLEVENNFPFEQIVENGKLIRTFLPDVDDEELKWHQDLKDRKVKIIEDGGWLFQMDDSLPIKLSIDEILSIPKLSWHRVIKGDNKLVVEIEEFN
jgi:hypothetical protein